MIQRKTRALVSVRFLLLFILGIVTPTVLVSCDVFMPNFLVGTWVASGKNGDEKFVFSKDGNFTADFRKDDGNVERISGKYKAGKGVIQFNYEQGNGIRKRTATYTMYATSMDFMFRGTKKRYFKF